MLGTVTVHDDKHKVTVVSCDERIAKVVWTPRLQSEFHDLLVSPFQPPEHDVQC